MFPTAFLAVLPLLSLAASSHLKCKEYKTPANLAHGSLTSSSGCGQAYTTRSGDTCSSILTKVDRSFTLHEFLAANPSINSECTNLHVGTAYCVKVSPCVAPGSHSIAKGCKKYAMPHRHESLHHFTKNHHLSTKQFRRLNKHSTTFERHFYCVSGPATVKKPNEHMAASDPMPSPIVERVKHNKANSEALHGDGTYFYPGLGSCGWTNSGSDLIAAASADLYAKLGNSICGKYLTVYRGSQSVRVRIVDECPPCALGSLDLSPAAFAKIAPLALGRVPISWDPTSLGTQAVRLLGI